MCVAVVVHATAVALTPAQRHQVEPLVARVNQVARVPDAMETTAVVQSLRVRKTFLFHLFNDNFPCCTFSALTLLTGRQEGHIRPVKN